MSERSERSEHTVVLSLRFYYIKPMSGNLTDMTGFLGKFRKHAAGSDQSLCHQVAAHHIAQVPLTRKSILCSTGSENMYNAAINLNFFIKVTSPRASALLRSTASLSKLVITDRKHCRRWLTALS